MIVDAHHHFWNLERARQPWMTAEHATIARTFEPEDLVPHLVAHGIERTVLVQGACSDDDTDYLCSLSASLDWIGAVTAWAALEEPPRCRERLDELVAWPKIRAIRHLIHDEPDPHWILRPPVLESLALLEERGLLLELPVVFPRHFADTVELARRFPDLTIVIDHLGKPPIGTDRMTDWEALIRACAGHPNVVAKVSGLNTAISREAWGVDDLRRPVEIAVDCFGPARLMCGSDWPVALLNGTYDRVWETLVEVVQQVLPYDADLVLGRTARSLYRLDGIDSAPTRPTGEARGRAH